MLSGQITRRSTLGPGQPRSLAVDALDGLCVLGVGRLMGFVDMLADVHLFDVLDEGDRKVGAGLEGTVADLSEIVLDADVTFRDDGDAVYDHQDQKSDKNRGKKDLQTDSGAVVFHIRIRIHE